MSDARDVATLAAAARGGRVASTPFLDPAEADQTLAALRSLGVAASAWGGYAGARRRVVTVRPDHVPEAAAVLRALYAPSARSGDALVVALRAAGVPADHLGDVVVHGDGVSVYCLDRVRAEALGRLRVDGVACAVEDVPPDRVAAGRFKRLTSVVPSLRVDVLGARAFGVSRAYFAQGVAAGRVRVRGVQADKRHEVDAGDEVWAEGLGRFRVTEVQGATRKGNVRVVLEVERAER